ncbi:hypothetical protein [Photorhabdus africana]|uniref:hypothetical protein n=1 Tax=Photorhabdus africana TaxID=3097554 RepID=UPI002B40D611|nr:hypothetical protein [Photorhabdus sp. CRI-LC]
MSTHQIVQLADSLVKGWETRIPAMKGEEWNQFRWWLNYLQGEHKKSMVPLVFATLILMNFGLA